MNKKLFCKSIAEFLGALAIVLFGCGTIAAVTTFEKLEIAPFVPIVFGATVGLMIYATGHLSGAHFNPAVTIGFALVRRFPWKEVPAYLFAQIIGGIVGSFLVSVFIQGTTVFGATTPLIPVLPALGVEIVLTFFLMFVIISVATDGRAVGIMAGAAIGITVMVDAFFGGSLTGASMNPARSIGPALLQGEFTGLWIYILGPILGAATAAYLYEFIRCEISNGQEEKRKEVRGCC